MTTWQNHLAEHQDQYLNELLDFLRIPSISGLAENAPDVRRAYRRFFEDSARLFDGYRPYAGVGLLFLYEQFYWENTEHFREVFRVKEHLCGNHILWEFVVEKTFTRENLSK